MILNCQSEIQLLSSNWLPGMLPLLLWPKKLLLGIGIGVGYQLFVMELAKQKMQIEIIVMPSSWGNEMKNGFNAFYMESFDCTQWNVGSS
jgi:hypothetical protein